MITSKIMVIFISVLIAVVTFIFLTTMQLQIRQNFENTITVINGKIIQSRNRSLLGIKEKINSLKRLGILDERPSLAEPVNYIGLHLMVGAIGSLIFILVFQNIWLVIPGLILGWLALDLYFVHCNNKDNAEIQQDVLLIANILFQQVRGGVYIASAFTECENSVKNKRLKKAMQEFNRQIILHEKTLLEALDEFENKFDSDDISAICSTIRQGEETGKMQDIILDLNKQITDMENISNDALKQKMDRTQTLVVMILFADILGFILYTAFNSILTTM